MKPPSSPIQAVVFDFDGTIADSEPIHYQALQATIEPFGQHFDLAFYKANLLGLEDYAVFQRCFQDRGADFWDTLVAKKALHFEELLPQINFLPGFEELLDQLTGKYRLAICSGALKQDVLGVFRAKKADALVRRFESIICADEVEHSKPDPTGYIRSCRVLGVDPAHTFAIEDTPVGLTAARGAGLKTAGITHSLSREILAPHADFVIDRLSEFLSLLT